MAGTSPLAARIATECQGNGDRSAPNGSAPRLDRAARRTWRARCAACRRRTPRPRVLSIGARAEGLTAADVGPRAGPDVGVARDAAPARGRRRAVGARPGRPGRSRVPGRALAAARPRRRRLRARPRGARRRSEAPLARPELRERLAAAGVDASGQRLPHLVAPRRPRRAACASGWTTRSRRSPYRGPRRARRRSAELGRPLPRRVRAGGAARPARLVGPARADVKDGVGGAAPDPARARCRPAGARRPVVRLLPAFDTYLLGYRERARWRPSTRSGCGRAAAGSTRWCSSTGVRRRDLAARRRRVEVDAVRRADPGWTTSWSTSAASSAGASARGSVAA